MRKNKLAKIKTEYITTDTSYRKLARKYKIPVKIISDAGKAEKWVEEKRQYNHKLSTETVKKICDEESDKLASLIKSADALAEVIQRAMEDPNQFNRVIVTKTIKDKVEQGNKTQETIKNEFEERIVSKVDTKAIREMTAAIKDLTIVIRNLNNLPTQAEAEAQSIAAGRFEIEKKRAEMDNNTDNTLVVKLEGLEEYSV